MLMQMHGKKGLNGDGRLLRWFLVPLLPKPHHCVGQHRLPFRDANSQDRKPPVLREIAHAVGIIPFTLPAQTSHPMGRNAGKQILGEIDALQIFEPVEQPVGRRRVRARLELAQPHKTGHPIISRLLEQCQQRHCCKVSDEAAFCLIQRPYISKTLLTRRISPRGSP